MKGSRFSKQVLIHPYDGYQGETHVVISGRVLFNREVVFSHEDSKFKNFTNSWNNFITNEIRKVKVFVQFEDLKAETITNKEGYFRFKLKTKAKGLSKKEATWKKYTITLDPSSVLSFQKDTHVEAEGRVYTPHLNCKYGLISDIDDTLVVTDVSTLWRWRMFYNSVFLSPFQRQIFKDGPRIIDLLAQRIEKDFPVFYISNSPNNLYYYIKTILNHSKFKQGPVFLRDIGRQLLRPRDFTEGNKYKQAFNLFCAYPHKKFILLGDAAEEDINIYYELSRVFPDRVHLIAIRSLGNKKKDQAISDIKINNPEVPMFLFKDYGEFEQRIGSLYFN